MPEERLWRASAELARACHGGTDQNTVGRYVEELTAIAPTTWAGGRPP
jgi:hypothetical protein